MTSGQRRWPPLVAALVSAVLVFLVLPNPLSIPQTNPSASAEYAPVPGDAQQAQSANFSQTSTATSAGVGAGGDGLGAIPGAPPQKIPEFKPRQKNCVGNPPRQTEDPLSPPCVPFFDGDNGGATATGVTKDDIVVILYNDRCCDGEITGPWKPSDEGTRGNSCIYPHECDNVVRTVKAQLRFFQRRYQTYGRRVRLIAQLSSGNLGATCASRQGDAKTAWDTYEPFAVVFMNEGNRECYMNEMLKHGVAGFGTGFQYTLKEYQERAPHVWGFFPGSEIRAEWGASLVCDTLQGHTAKYAGDPDYHDDVRKFGLIWPEGDSRGPELRESAELFREELKRRCGFTFDMERRFNASQADGAGAGTAEAPTIISQFKSNGITTVFCYCISVPTENTVPTMQKQATSQEYFPEWVWPCCMQSAVSHQTYGDKAQESLGISTIWRQPAFREQYHYQAYLSEEPGSQPNVFWNFSVYTLFLNLYQAIQAAGPDLTLETVKQGMFTFNWTQRENVWVPTGGYGNYNRNAVAPYNFVDTATLWWWDPTGAPPGRPAEGCLRVINEGLQYYAGEFPPDSGAGIFFKNGDPCTENVVKIADPSAGVGGF